MAVFRGTGTSIRLGNGASPEVFTAVGDVISVDGPNITKDQIEVTALDSSAKEFLDDIDDAGDVTVEMNWNPQDAQQVALRSDAEGSSARNFRIIYNDVSSTQVDFSGRVLEFNINVQAADAVKATARIKVSGSLTWS